MPFMRFLALILVITVFCVALVFMVQNKDQTAFLVFGTTRTDPIPVYMLLMAAFLVGVVFTSVIGIIEGMKMRVSNARLKNRARRLQEELDMLRNLPLSGPVDEGRSAVPPNAAEDDSAL